MRSWMNLFACNPFKFWTRLTLRERGSLLLPETLMWIGVSRTSHKPTSLHPLTISLICCITSGTQMTLTIWVTAVCVLSVNCCKTNSESSYHGWSVWYVSGSQSRIRRGLHHNNVLIFVLVSLRSKSSLEVHSYHSLWIRQIHWQSLHISGDCRHLDLVV